MQRQLAGFVAGILATIPMSIAMLLLHKLLVGGDVRSLPPYQVTMRTSDKLGFWHRLLGEEQRTGAALLAHFSYGGLAGALYTVLAPAVSRLPLPQNAQGFAGGLLYGVAFWAANYAGLLPALDLYQSPDDQDPNRNAVILGAHLVWGASLGPLVQALGGDKDRSAEDWTNSPYGKRWQEARR